MHNVPVLPAMPTIGRFSHFFVQNHNLRRFAGAIELRCNTGNHLADGVLALARRLQSLVPENAPRSERLGFRQRVVGIYTFLILANLSVWVWAFTAFAHQPVLIGTAILAYSLGLLTPSMPTTLRRSTT
jgi:hypothetical protein